MARKAKNKVSIVDDRGKIRLYWRFNSSPYYISTSLDYLQDNFEKVKDIIRGIESDIKKGQFDATKERYTSLLKELIGGKVEAGIVCKVEKPVNPIVTHFEFWVKEYRHKDCEKHVDYHSCRNMLKRWGNFKLTEALSFMNLESFNEKTYNRRLNLLKLFFAWGIKHKGYKINPFEDVAKKSHKKRAVRPQRLPFTVGEIIKILDALKNNTFCSPNSRYPHSHYYPFLYFIFHTGVRNAEGVGIRVKHILLGERLIKIEEVMARNLSLTHGSARIRKETKNGKVRHIPLNDELKEVLLPLLIGKDPDELIFTSFHGLPIDDRAFQRRVLRPIMKELELPERDLYASRHAFASRSIAGNLNPILVAFLMGNNPVTALRHYTHVQDLPEQLPMLNPIQ